MVRKQSFKILVTGGAGFIGSEFVRQAAASGYPLVVVDQLTYAGDRERLETVKEKFTFYKTDIVNPRSVSDIFKRERPSAVVHFAAESHVDRSILNDSEFIKTNINGTQNLLSVCRQAGIERFVHMSTDEVYGEISRGTFKEDFPLVPNSPYSASKGAADLLIGAYVHTFKFPAMIVRPSNNYGPWQYPEKFIPVIIYKALHNEKIPVYAKGLNVREWLHTSDCSRAVLKVLERGVPGEIYNVGSGEERTNIDLVKMILGLLDRPEHLIAFVEDRPGHDWRYALDSNKIRKELGWKPEISFEQGMTDTVTWYQENLKWLQKKVKFLKSYWQKVYR